MSGCVSSNPVHLRSSEGAHKDQSKTPPAAFSAPSYPFSELLRIEVSISLQSSIVQLHRPMVSDNALDKSISPMIAVSLNQRAHTRRWLPTEMKGRLHEIRPIRVKLCVSLLLAALRCDN